MAGGFQILDIAGFAVAVATLFFAIFRMKSPKKKLEEKTKTQNEEWVII